MCCPGLSTKLILMKDFSYGEYVFTEALVREDMAKSQFLEESDRF